MHVPRAHLPVYELSWICGCLIIDRKWFRPQRGATQRMTSLIDLATQFLFRSSADVFCPPISVQKLLNIFVCGAQTAAYELSQIHFLFVCLRKRPQDVRTNITTSTSGTFLRHTASFELPCTVVVFHVGVGRYDLTDSDENWHICRGRRRNESCTCWCLYVDKFVYATGRIWGFTIGSSYKKKNWFANVPMCSARKPIEEEPAHVSSDRQYYCLTAPVVHQH